MILLSLLLDSYIVTKTDSYIVLLSLLFKENTIFVVDGVLTTLLKNGITKKSTNSLSYEYYLTIDDESRGS